MSAAVEEVALPGLGDIEEELPATPPSRTYGRLHYHLGREHRQGTWGIEAQPHVLIRLKRMFPRVRQAGGRVTIADTDEVARDLEWVMMRWPLEMDPATARRLRGAVRRHRDTEASVAAILSGQALDTPTVREPAVQLREYQQVAADIVTAMRRVLITDELGLGKTFEALATLRNPDALPAAVVVPTHLQTQWEAQIARMWPELRVYRARTTNPVREGPFRRYLDTFGAPHIIVLTYSKLSGWQQHLAGTFKTLLMDEAHELRNGRDSAKGSAAGAIADAATYVVGATGSAVVNYADDLWHEFHVLEAGFLGTHEEFMREHGGRTIRVGGIGGRTVPAVKDPAALGLYLRDSGRVIGRTRTEVGRELPYGEALKVPHRVDCDTDVLEKMTGDAVEMARFILEHTGPRLESERATEMEFDSLMRQATGIAKAPYVATFVQTLLETTDRVVLWGWHHAVYDLWVDALKGNGVALYTGQQTVRQRDDALRRFQLPLEHPDAARVLIMSLRTGSGIDGIQEHCSVGVFGELDWSPEIHRQCGGRLARDGQENEVVTYYLTSDSGADPKMLEVLGVKHQQAEGIRDPHAPHVEVLPTPDTSRVRRLAEDVLRQRGVYPTKEPSQ